MAHALPVTFAQALAQPVDLGDGFAMRVGRREDVSAIVAIEHRSDMRAFIATWDRRKHEARIDDPEFGYVVFERDAGTCGYAILSGHATGHRAIRLLRIALASFGTGLGTRALLALRDFVFERLGAHRFDLDVMADNVRARRAYARIGLVEEGVMRDALSRDDGFVDLVLLAMLEDRWRALREGSLDAVDPIGRESGRSSR